MIPAPAEFPNDVALPLVSVVVPTKNGRGIIKSALESVRRQEYPRIELVCVDNYSNDGTYETEQTYCNPIRQRGGLAVQVNEGVRKSTGDFVLWIDQDFVLHPKVIAECVQSCLTHGYNAIVIPEIRRGSGWMQARQIEVSLYTLSGDVGVRFFCRELFDAVGGLDETLPGMRDYDLGFRMLKQGARIGEIRSGVISTSEDTLQSYIRRYYQRGSALKEVSARHGSNLVLAPYIYLAKHPLYIFKAFAPGLVIRFLILKFVVGLASLVSLLTQDDKGSIRR